LEYIGIRIIKADVPASISLHTFIPLFSLQYRVFLPKKAKEMHTNNCLQVRTVLLN